VAGHGAAADDKKPPRDAHPLLRADWHWGRLEGALNLIAAVSIFAIMVLGVLQIASRVGSAGARELWPEFPPIAIHGYIDWIEFVAVLYALLGIAYCQRLGGHIRMEIVLASIRGRARWLLELLGIALALAITLLLVHATFENFLRAWINGDSSMDIRLPQWPSKLVVPVALAVLAVRLALQLWGYARLVLWPTALPMAVPLVVTADEAARQEIAETEMRERRG